MSSFVYAALHDADKRIIRLVKLEPLPPNNGSQDGSRRSENTPHCQLIEASLEKAPPFIVVSHVRDATTTKQTIYINGSTFRASGTLADLLKYLQRYCRPATSFFWIEALCINQHDDTEKGLQAPLMRQILETAWVVIGWLGGVDENDDLYDRQCLSDVQSVHRFFQAYSLSQDRYGIAMKRKEPLYPTMPYAHRTKEVLVYEVDSDESLPSTRSSSISTVDDMSKVNEGSSIVEARLKYHLRQVNDQDWSWCRVSKLLCHAWFRRIELVQEIYCAKNAQVAYGPHMLSWKVLSEVCQDIMKYGLEKTLCHFTGTDRVCPPGFSSIMFLQKLCEFKIASQTPSLSSLMFGTSSLKAGDARDKLYSILSLAPQSERILLPVDYTMMAENVFVRLATHFLTWKGQDWEVLSAAGLGWRRSSNELPSWVPDWGSLPACLSNMFREWHDSKPREEPAAAAQNPTSNFTIGPDRRTLRVRGCIVDKVQYLIRQPAPEIASLQPDAAGDTTSSWTDWMLSAVDMLTQRELQPYPTHEPLDEVLWRTLITNQSTENTSPAGSEYGTSFRRFVGRPFESAFNTLMPSELSRHTAHLEEQRRLVSTLERHINSPLVSPGLAYIERMSHTPQTFELERTWKQSYEIHGQGRCLFTTKRGFVGLAAPGLAEGGEMYVAYIRGYGKPLILKRELCHEKESRRSATGGNASHAEEEQSPRPHRLRLVSDCYVHGGRMLERKARSFQVIEIY